MHPLGQRRVYALRREPLRELRDWLDPFERDHPSEGALVDYERAIEAERARAARAARGAPARTLAFERDLPAPAASVWRAWTSADAVRHWWSPDHFTVADCEVDPVVGGRLRIVLAEGDGTPLPAAGPVPVADGPRAR